MKNYLYECKLLYLFYYEKKMYILFKSDNRLHRCFAVRRLSSPRKSDRQWRNITMIFIQFNYFLARAYWNKSHRKSSIIYLFKSAFDYINLAVSKCVPYWEIFRSRSKSYANYYKEKSCWVKYYKTRISYIFDTFVRKYILT